MDNVPVKIIVKAPNQQFEDQTIQCELSWTIKRLKGYLSEVYPCKPSTEEQKLIYSGQLLSDAVTLKEILRQYDGQNTHTVHLVYTPKNRPDVLPKLNESQQSTTNNVNAASSIQNSISTDGLRQRNITGSTNAATFQPFNNSFPQLPQMPYISNTSNSVAANRANTFYSVQQQILAQQMDMQQIYMQQYYMQYMHQYMNAYQQQQQPNVQQNINIPPMPFFTHQQQQQQQFASDIPAVQRPPQPPVDPVQIGNQAQPPPQQQPDNNQVAAPRFGNIAGEDGERLDWLDLFYVFSRLMVLVTLVYFYSSPFRCLIVIFFMFLYYFYRTGYLQQFNQEPNNNNANQRNNAQQQPQVNNDQNRENNNNDAQPAVANVDDGVHGDLNRVENVDAPAAAAAVPTNDEAAQEQNNRTPVIVLLRTFVLSFFASLIPETPAL